MADDIPPELSDAALLARANRAAMAGNGEGEIIAAAPYGRTDALAHGFTFGLSDMASAAGLAANRYLTGTSPGFDYSQAATEIKRGREAYQNQAPFENAALNIAGSVGNPAGQIGKLMPAMGRLGQIATGIATGGGVGAVQGAAENSATPQDAWQGALEGGKTGAIVGGAIPATIAAARTLVPGSPQAQVLRAAGVEPPPGATAGGLLGTLEDLWGRIPILGRPVQVARQRAQEQFGQAVENQSEAFNRSTINNVLGHVGQSLDADTPIGNSAISQMADKASAAYEAVVPNAGAKFDDTIIRELEALRSNAKLMPADRARQFEDITKTYVLNKVSPDGVLSGEAFKQAESDLGKKVAQFRASNDADQNQLGESLRDVQSTLRNWLARANPDSAAEIQAANQTWAKMLRVQDAAASHPEGVLTPANVLNASRKYGGRAQFARGGALMEDIGQQGRQEQQGLTEAGKWLRAPEGPMGLGAGVATGVVGGGLLQYLLANPLVAAAGAAAYPAVAGAYSNPGRAAINAMKLPSLGFLAPQAAQYATSQGPGLLSGLLRP